MKHYIDIDNARMEDITIGDLIRKNNIEGFQPGDIIQISEKIDGSNASAYWDLEADTMMACSRKQDLNFKNTLNGFYTYVQNFSDNVKDVFYNFNDWIVFGEWTGARNKIMYRPETMKKWYIFDIWDTYAEQWLPQERVDMFCGLTGLDRVHVFYTGPFISWEHVASFLHQPQYGLIQEGVVVKNMSRLNNNESRLPSYLKIVNEDFKESKIKRKEIDPEVAAAKMKAEELMGSIVTKARVEKMLLKLRDEQLIPSEITPKDMKIVAQNLPKRIYDDCMKEEPEVMKACGEYAGKSCGGLAMKIAREIILGN